MGEHLNWRKEANEFLKVCDQFQLGVLPTESPNPKTLNLSDDAQNNVIRAINTLKEIDIEVFSKLLNTSDELKALHISIFETLNEGGNIFLCGCGATGRLSLALETIWRIQHSKNDNLRQRVFSFMAGGDVALIHSIEKFEDFPEFGERQLLELGFKRGDLLISCTEGGETPFVIGATEAALKVSQREPFFLYCNPDEVLVKTAQRSKRVIENDKIRKINLSVGPMALTGSTRMQATTILMYGVGLCLWFQGKDFVLVAQEIKKLITLLEVNTFDNLSKFIEEESRIYQSNEYIYYQTDQTLGISILTDTTERSPTFSLHPFENQNDHHKKPSLSYLFFPNSANSLVAWEDLLGRKPRTFHWSEVTDQTSSERLIGFDFSQKLPKLRNEYLKANHHFFKISLDENNKFLSFNLNHLEWKMPISDLSFLSIHLLLKIILNNHSTLVMGRLGRYESNLMTWVRASNYKLIDRAVRYAKILLEKKGIIVSYNDLVLCCFELKEHTPRDHSLVLKMVNQFRD